MLGNKKKSKREKGRVKSFMAFAPRQEGKVARVQFKPVRKKAKRK